MKKLLMITLALSCQTVFANVDFQMLNAPGDWDFGKNSSVLRITKHDEQSIKALVCDRADWLATNRKRCSYSSVAVFEYNSFIRGFCRADHCGTSLKVSLNQPNELIEMADPLFINRVSDSGEVVGYGKKSQ